MTTTTDKTGRSNPTVARLQEARIESENKLREAVKANDNLSKAVEAFHGTDDTAGRTKFWRRVARLADTTERDQIRAKYAAQVIEHRSRNAGSTGAYSGRDGDLIEDAAFLAKHGEHPAGAAKRLGLPTVNALEKRLSRLGRYDIFNTLANNDPMYMQEYWGARGGQAGRKKARA